MRDSTQVLVKVVLFQLRGRGHPQGDATPNFFPDSKSFFQGFQMRYHLFLEFLEKVVKTRNKTEYYSVQRCPEGYLDIN